MNIRARRFVSFWRDQGTAAVIRLLRVKAGNAIAGRPLFNPLDDAADARVSVARMISKRFPALRPIPTYFIPKPSLRRVSLITDSIGPSSLFGGVGTGLLLAARLANRMNATLRIVTRTERPSPENAGQILRAYGIDLLHEIQFAYVPEGGVSPDDAGPPLDIHSEDIFITTSWWTTAASLSGIPSHSILYLLQEDERMFYPFGEDRFQCEQVLRNESIRFLVNTKLLYDHLISSGLEHLKRTGQWFEPAFPPSLFHRRTRAGGKRRFFYYARPHNSRNLFHVGLAAIDRAVNEGILDLDHWEIFLVGKDIPPVSVGSSGYEPVRCEGLQWQAYADLVGSIDLGLSLMYTPHPSYPPLDLAASGAVVVTNKFANKISLAGYSPNILCSELQPDALVDAIRTGVLLAEDDEARERNFQANRLSADWADSFESIIASLTAED
ncbi:hypothetical protein [Variovorax sp. Sphag1AA]|uniref:rhamnosyltransferase WsaF family glycosyltransferase n=1 Tax=Variovorax sp. Sphag1AA TaxID=2587027 RepID=UPI00161620DA|nr:hypothetical protein [Variovorax sp. Sphag1AA]MBB3179816.1 hypothetical protein [Variovorax sp. Sphag1AA]